MDGWMDMYLEGEDEIIYNLTKDLHISTGRLRNFLWKNFEVR
jgi:hypothetical protein